MPAEPKLPLFTVVVALHNKRAHVQDTLRSVLAQQDADFNIVVVDDGSTDDSADQVRALADPRIHLITQANGGVSRARNVGVIAATGHWCVFLDADDLQRPQFLTTLRSLMQHHPDCGMVASAYVDLPADAKRAWLNAAASAPTLAATPPNIEVIEDLPSRWMSGRCFFTSSVAVKRSLLQALPSVFPAGESHGEDLDVWFRLAERTPIAYTSLPLVARVMDPTGLSSQVAARSEPPFAERMAQRVRQGDCPERLRRSSLRYVIHYRLFLARTAVVGGHRSLALGLLWRVRAVCYTPGWLLTLLLTLLPRRWAYALHRWRIDAKVSA
ncbi:MAG: glycosyltransferase family A protein [Ideonella sp.]|nr:glycosyltransferase family A protein [Ideonella sp.]